MITARRMPLARWLVSPFALLLGGLLTAGEPDFFAHYAGTIPGQPAKVSRLDGASDGADKIKVDAFGVFTAKGHDKVRWKVEPVYELAKDSKGEPYLKFGDLDVLTLKKPASIPQREGLKLVDVEAYSAVVWGKQPGKVKLIALAVVDGWPEEIETIALEVLGEVLPPVDPDKPVDPVPTGSLYFAIVRKTGPITADVEKCLKLEAWTEVRAKGHKVRDLMINQVPVKDGKTIPGLNPPCLLVLKTDGKTSALVGPVRSMPANDAEVKALLEIKP